jgi:hypothetical protein
MGRPLPTNHQVRELHVKINHHEDILSKNTFAVLVWGREMFRYHCRYMEAIHCPQTAIEKRQELGVVQDHLVCISRIGCILPMAKAQEGSSQPLRVYTLNIQEGSSLFSRMYTLNAGRIPPLVVRVHS